MEYNVREFGTAAKLATWQDLVETDDAPSCPVEGHYTTVQVSGDAEGVEIHGSISGEQFDPLHDRDNLPLHFSFPGIKSTGDMYRAIKPVKRGPGTATVSILIRRN